MARMKLLAALVLCIVVALVRASGLSLKVQDDLGLFEVIPGKVLGTLRIVNMLSRSGLTFRVIPPTRHGGIAQLSIVAQDSRARIWWLPRSTGQREQLLFPIDEIIDLTLGDEFVAIIPNDPKSSRPTSPDQWLIAREMNFPYSSLAVQWRMPLQRSDPYAVLRISIVRHVDDEVGADGERSEGDWSGDTGAAYCRDITGAKQALYSSIDDYETADEEFCHPCPHYCQLTR